MAGREILRAGRYGVGGLLDRIVGVFGRDRVFVELQRHGVRDEEADNELLADLAAVYHVPVVATNGVRFAMPEERPVFDVLTCIHHGVTLESAGRRLAPNAERYLKAPAQMAALFRDRPHLLAAADALADRLQFTMADLGYRFPEYPVPPGESMQSFLRAMTDIGARDRYRPYHDRARAQIARELDLIGKLDLAGYFLIVWDIVNFCRQHDILVQGRGSAANSAVCYSLGITAVDPVGMDLLFERFLSEERGEWPDIDLDLPSGDRREQVIQYVYQRYGELGAGMTANVITYRGRSAAREAGKALGLDESQIDGLARAMNRFEYTDSSDTLARHLTAGGFDLKDPRIELFADLWRRMQDLPRHLGQHSGGMVICQGRLDSVVPLEQASMPGRVVVQWDKDDCAEMGIIKVDLLGLGMMAALQEAIAIVNTPAPGSRLQAPSASGPGPKPGKPAVCSPQPAARLRSRPSSPRRPRRLPSAPDCRHDRALPGGIARADGRAAAPASGSLLRPRRASRHHPAGTDCRTDGASVSESARGTRGGRISPPFARTHPEAHAWCAALSGAAAAHGDDGGRLHGWAGRRAPARDGLQALRKAHAADRSAPARGHGKAGHRGRRRRKPSSNRSPRLRSTAFPNRTRPASRCSRTPAGI